MGNKSAQRMFLVKVDGIEGYFQTKTGGNITATGTKVFDGGSKVPDIIAGTPDTENITVARAYDSVRDGALCRALRQQVSSWVTTVSVTPTDADFNAVEQPTVYSNARLLEFHEYDVDSSSGDAAMFELVFGVGSVR